MEVLSERGPHRYLVKELFGPTIQGEGAHAGRACVFLRFAVCNLACAWCDTDFRPEGATRMTAPEIVRRLVELDVHRARMVVVTGGEPALQWDEALRAAVAAAGFRAHMETNGTRALAAAVDWLTVSPKPQWHEGKESLVVTRADECKVVVDDTVDEAVLAGYEAHAYGAWFLQPCMDARHAEHLARAIELVARRPRWRLSVQLHKVIGVP
jgi:organic radical activating enzyme